MKVGTSAHKDMKIMSQFTALRLLLMTEAGEERVRNADESIVDAHAVQALNPMQRHVFQHALPVRMHEDAPHTPPFLTSSPRLIQNSVQPQQVRNVGQNVRHAMLDSGNCRDALPIGGQQCLQPGMACLQMDIHKWVRFTHREHVPHLCRAV